MLRKNLLQKVTWLLCLIAATMLMPLSAASEHFRTVNVKDGLADNFVRDITTDSEGYVWFSTINGVNRYDGYRFLNFQPQQWGGRSADVAMVRETADRTLWMLTTSGELFTYRRAEQTWQMDGTQRLQKMGIKGSSLSAFYIDDCGGLWAATEQGVWHQDFHDVQGGQAKAFTLPAGTSSLPVLHIVSRQGTTFIITADYYI